jgi:MSHA biogenesis protein MshJ
VIAVPSLAGRLRPIAERLDGLTLRERIFILTGCLALMFVAWQSLVMGPLAARARADEQRLADAHQQIAVIDQLDAAASHDPAAAAAMRNRALSDRLAALDKELSAQAQGYIDPQRMTDLLRALLAEQRSLKLVSLTNLPVESLSRNTEKEPSATSATPDGGATHDGGVAPSALDSAERGPYLHPVEIVVDGDYASTVAYLRSIERLPWRIQWRKLELTSGEYPVNRIHLVIGALSLSRDWISV